MALSRLLPASFEQPNPTNFIINGDCSVSQRSTSETGVTSSGYKTVDRFRPSLGTAGTWTITQSTDVPTGQGFANSLKFDCTTANSSLSAGSDMALQYRFEGQDLQLLKKGTSSAVPVTLSFWVKSTKTGTFICELKDDDNSRQISKAYTISSSNTWEKKELTFAGDTTGALDDDNAKSLTILWWQVAGANFNNPSGTLNTSWAGSVSASNRAIGQVNIADDVANDWLITGVCLNEGSHAISFPHESFAENLAKCHRYYQEVSMGAFYINSLGTDYIYRSLLLPVKPRATPTIAVHTQFQYYSGGNAANFTPTFGVSGDGLAHQHVVVFGSSLTNANGLYTGTFSADAEL